MPKNTRVLALFDVDGTLALVGLFEDSIRARTVGAREAWTAAAATDAVATDAAVPRGSRNKGDETGGWR